MKEIRSDQNFQAWARLSQTRDIIFKAREKELGQSGISSAEARALLVLGAMDAPITLTELSRWLIREPHTVSSLLNRMEREGLVKKTKDLNKKNILRISLTQKGKQSRKQVTKMKPIQRIFSRLTEEQRQQLISCLEILLKESLRETKVGWKILPFP